MERLVNARVHAAEQIKSFPAVSQLTHCRLFAQVEHDCETDSGLACVNQRRQLKSTPTASAREDLTRNSRSADLAVSEKPPIRVYHCR
jgi:hypothetical protein